MYLYNIVIRNLLIEEREFVFICHLFAIQGENFVSFMKFDQDKKMLIMLVIKTCGISPSFFSSQNHILECIKCSQDNILSK